MHKEIGGFKKWQTKYAFITPQAREDLAIKETSVFSSYNKLKG